MKQRTARLFKNGRSLAVRLPKDWVGKADEVTLERTGDKIVISPRKKTVREIAARLAASPSCDLRLPAQSITPPPSLGD